jgi:hypothetical protein
MGFSSAYYSLPLDVIQKHEFDRIGGETLRRASMEALSRKRKRQPQVAREAESDTADNENEPTSSATTSHSSKNADTNDQLEPRKSKRRRLSDSTLEFQEELIGAFRQDMKSREECQKAMDEQLKGFMESSRKQGQEICDILKGLVELERSRALARQMSVEL